MFIRSYNRLMVIPLTIMMVFLVMFQFYSFDAYAYTEDDYATWAQSAILRAVSEFPSRTDYFAYHDVATGYTYAVAFDDPNHVGYIWDSYKQFKLDPADGNTSGDVVGFLNGVYDFNTTRTSSGYYISAQEYFMSIDELGVLYDSTDGTIAATLQTFDDVIADAVVSHGSSHPYFYEFNDASARIYVRSVSEPVLSTPVQYATNGEAWVEMSTAGDMVVWSDDGAWDGDIVAGSYIHVGPEASTHYVIDSNFHVVNPETGASLYQATSPIITQPSMSVRQIFNGLEVELSGHQGLSYAELTIYQLDQNMVGYNEATQSEILLGTYDTVNTWYYPLAYDLSNDPDAFIFNTSDGWDYTQDYRAVVEVYDIYDTLHYTLNYYPDTQAIEYDPTQTNETIFDGWYVKYGLTGFTIQSQVMTFDNSYIKVKDSAGNVVATSIEYDFVRNTDVIVPYGFSPIEGQTYYLNIIQSRLGPDIPILVDYEFTYGVTDSTVNTGQDLDVYQENQDTLNDMIEKAEDGLQSMYDLARGGLLLYGLMFAWLPYPLNQYGMILGVLVAVSFIIKWLLGRG